MADCVTLWIGDLLGPVERACLRSVMRHGHSLALYCYRRPDGLPEGVEVRDAAEILPAKYVFLHRRKSFAPFSDWFRYELQERGAGTWVDADVYLLASLDRTREYLFGEEAPGTINNAVLRLPPGSEAVRQLLAPFRTKTRPPWMKWSLLEFLRSGRGRNPRSLPWGTTGPAAMTAVARDLGLEGYAYSPDVLYPARWEQADWIVKPEITLDQVITSRTLSVHLWNGCIERFKNDPAPAGSFLERLHAEGRA